VTRHTLILKYLLITETRCKTETIQRQDAKQRRDRDREARPGEIERRDRDSARGDETDYHNLMASFLVVCTTISTITYIPPQL